MLDDSSYHNAKLNLDTLTAGIEAGSRHLANRWFEKLDMERTHVAIYKEDLLQNSPTD